MLRPTSSSVLQGKQKIWQAKRRNVVLAIARPGIIFSRRFLVIGIWAIWRFASLPGFAVALFFFVLAWREEGGSPAKPEDFEISIITSSDYIQGDSECNGVIDFRVFLF